MPLFGGKKEDKYFQQALQVAASANSMLQAYYTEYLEGYPKLRQQLIQKYGRTFNEDERLEQLMDDFKSTMQGFTETYPSILKNEATREAFLRNPYPEGSENWKLWLFITVFAEKKLEK